MNIDNILLEDDYTKRFMIYNSRFLELSDQLKELYEERNKIVDKMKDIQDSYKLVVNNDNDFDKNEFEMSFKQYHDHLKDIFKKINSTRDERDETIKAMRKIQDNFKEQMTIDAITEFGEKLEALEIA